MSGFDGGRPVFVPPYKRSGSGQQRRSAPPSIHADHIVTVRGAENLCFTLNRRGQILASPRNERSSPSYGYATGTQVRSATISPCCGAHSSFRSHPDSLGSASRGGSSSTWSDGRGCYTTPASALHRDVACTCGYREDIAGGSSTPGALGSRRGVCSETIHEEDCQSRASTLPLRASISSPPEGGFSVLDRNRDETGLGETTASISSPAEGGLAGRDETDVCETGRSRESSLSVVTTTGSESDAGEDGLRCDVDLSTQGADGGGETSSCLEEDDQSRTLDPEEIGSPLPPQSLSLREVNDVWTADDTPCDEGLSRRIGASWDGIDSSVANTPFDRCSETSAKESDGDDVEPEHHMNSLDFETQQTTDPASLRTDPPSLNPLLTDPPSLEHDASLVQPMEQSDVSNPVEHSDIPYPVEQNGITPVHPGKQSDASPVDPVEESVVEAVVVQEVAQLPNSLPDLGRRESHGSGLTSMGAASVDSVEGNAGSTVPDVLSSAASVAAVESPSRSPSAGSPEQGRGDGEAPRKSVDVSTPRSPESIPSSARRKRVNIQSTEDEPDEEQPLHVTEGDPADHHLTLTGTFKRGQKAGQKVDVRVEITREKLEKIDRKIQRAQLDKRRRCCLGLSKGPHVFLTSLLVAPFVFILASLYSFYMGTLTWYNVLLCLDQRSVCCRILVAPFLILMYPPLILLCSLCLGLYAGIAQISWYSSSWCREMSDMEKGFFGWLCAGLRLESCSPYEVIILEDMHTLPSSMDEP
ncbi:unnamed protein product [Cyprideis torosa]|uniref:Uncharacterized protein n=1 Tax=Cyprideis torosa TaxID=163714 RepID=A0A7R8ZSB3_9CRUS|nr:unnamed protein product [Cyprideis torosa]CAG0901200.1 unnamed protein product [Cyprideis torosa]